MEEAALPREWAGYHEIMGLRRRYRLINLDRLCWRLGAGSLNDVRKHLEASLAERTARDQVKRDPGWTESLAVGSSGRLEKIRPLILSRLERGRRADRVVPCLGVRNRSAAIQTEV